EHVLLNLDIQFHDRLSADDIEAAVDRLEKQIREKYPEIKHIFLEAEAISIGKRRKKTTDTPTEESPPA
ncbi:MAG: hypothetical protein KDA84_01980, partial [Planctomycetaceae bacterium]|nr:hypothetical protein [Planctomycetaceae bacterium]